MKKFSFRLDPVLKYKNDLMEIIKAEHADAVKKVNVQNDFIKELEYEKNQKVQEFDDKKKNGISIAEAAMYEGYLHKQNYMISLETEKLHQLMKQEDEKREKMVDAKKEILSIEKLKDIKIDEYNKETQKENELFIEEFVSNARVRA